MRERKHKRSAKLHALDKLRRLWAEGLASGPGKFRSITSIKREARRRLKKAG